ncbi:MAG: hypothetical protein K8R54_06335 [Bacteroidales bacterium]|nr:hypothetical protein [Bacteroidales bacterium]
MAQSINYKEGQSICFKINKHIELSKNESYFVLEDQFGRKQLLKSDFYENYKFKIGQDMNCRVDHINCSGKIFLEPEHPVYTEGEIYDFIIDKIEASKNRLEEQTLHFSFVDTIGNTAICITENEAREDYSVGQKIQCKLERIIKGRLNLSFANNDSVNFKRDRYYKFKIDDIRILKDNIKYYILSDNDKQKYLLAYEYYEHHDLIIGQTIECMIIKFSPKGYYILEPKHPFYESGTIYSFEFVKQEKDAKGEITGNYDVTVKDVFGEEVNFKSEKSLLIDGVKPEHIKCKVSGVKKGKPLLYF